MPGQNIRTANAGLLERGVQIPGIVVCVTRRRAVVAPTQARSVVGDHAHRRGQGRLDPVPVCRERIQACLQDNGRTSGAVAHDLQMESIPADVDHAARSGIPLGIAARGERLNQRSSHSTGGQQARDAERPTLHRGVTWLSG